MATCGPTDIAQMKLLRVLDMTYVGYQTIPCLLTGVHMSTGKYNNREGKVPLGHRPYDRSLENHPYMVPAFQFTPTVSHKIGSIKHLRG